MSLKDVCRACLTTDRTLCCLRESIVPKFDSPPDSVVDQWNIFTKLLTAYEDRFPDKICMECFNEIQRTYSFILKCERSEQIFKNEKSIKISFNELNNVSVSRANSSKYIKSENDICPTAQIKTEKIEWNDGYDEEDADRGKFDVNFHANVDNNVDPRSQHTSLVQDANLGFEQLEDHFDCKNDVMNDEISAKQDIKQEPELDICIENYEFDEIESDDKSISVIFKCPVCRFGCDTRESFEKHLIENHIEGQVCKLCKKEFTCTAIEHCFVHLRVNSIEAVLQSTNMKQHKCKVCSKICTSESNLNQHLTTHTGERPFKCENCPKTFVQKRNLTLHLRCHTGVRPFKCENCPKAFLQKGALMVHLRCHTGERPFKCEICPKTFVIKGDLTRHLVSHTGERPFKCEICSKTFRQKCGLTEHLRSHSGERPFKCDFCPKTYRHKTDLTNHLRNHNGGRPFHGILVQKLCDMK